MYFSIKFHGRTHFTYVTFTFTNAEATLRLQNSVTVAYVNHCVYLRPGIRIIIVGSHP